MVQPVAFYVVMLSSLALLVLAPGRVLCGASGPVDGEDRSVAIPLENERRRSLSLFDGGNAYLNHSHFAAAGGGKLIPQKFFSTASASRNSTPYV
jgi:hypothetical protein